MPGGAAERNAKKIAASHNAPIFEAKSDWYGSDPIHIRRKKCREIWSEVLGTWSETPTDFSCADPARLQAMYLRCLHPESWTLFGVGRHARQPNGRLHDGTTLALF